MTMRKRAVRRSSTVRTQAGGEGMVCEGESVEPLSFLLLVVFEVEMLGPGEVGGERDTSSGLCRYLRGMILEEMSRWAMGIQEVLVVGLDLVVVRD